MNSLLKRTLGVAITSAAILSSASVLADNTTKPVNTDVQYAKRIAGNWHLSHTIDVQDKKYDVHVSMLPTQKLGGTFHAYLNETSHPTNQMITADGTYSVANNNLTVNIVDSNVPVPPQKKHETLGILKLTRHQLTLDAHNETVTFNREG